MYNQLAFSFQVSVSSIISRTCVITLSKVILLDSEKILAGAGLSKIESKRRQEHKDKKALWVVFFDNWINFMEDSSLSLFPDFFGLGSDGKFPQTLKLQRTKLIFSKPEIRLNKIIHTRLRVLTDLSDWLPCVSLKLRTIIWSNFLGNFVLSRH